MEIAIAIAACEIAFWLLLFGGMAARYWWRRRRLSTVLLALIPVADALLLAFTAVDLARGAEAAWSHGLAALYLGFSVLLGPLVVASMDRRFAKRPRGEGRRWRLWLRVVGASALAALVLGGLALLADDPEPLYGWFGTLALICGGWLVFGPLWPSRQKGTRMNRLAPWWAYLVPFLAFNYARAAARRDLEARRHRARVRRRGAGLRHGAPPRGPPETRKPPRGRSRTLWRLLPKP